MIAIELAIGETFIRLNQIGLIPEEEKTATIISDEDLISKTVEIKNQFGEIIYTGKIFKDLGKHFNYNHSYSFDFSPLETIGLYNIHIDDIKSPLFNINYNLYNPILDSLSVFLRIQRCGSNNPLYHKPCHHMDASRVIGYPNIKGKIDLTGGWHDAGDYSKFLNTTAYTVYMLLLAYEYFPRQFRDNDRNGTVDIVDEALIGIEWMLKMHPEKRVLLTQVRSDEENNVGWRLPENDKLTSDRPALSHNSKTHCGIFSAALALAAGTFERIGRKKESKTFLNHAEEVYNLGGTSIQNTSSGPDSAYYDSDFRDNMALAAIELYRTTGKETYLDDALCYIEELEVAYWVSWGDLTGLFHARILKYSLEAQSLLKKTLKYFSAASEKDPFGYPLTIYPWGSASIQVGIAMLGVVYYEESHDWRFLNLVHKQRDFILGKNSHGVCFISQFGSDFPKHFHHQISYLKNIPLTGAFAAGLVSPDAYKGTFIQRSEDDRFKKFQNEKAVYYDDRNDYLTNEPTIVNNAQAILLFSWLSEHSQP